MPATAKSPRMRVGEPWIVDRGPRHMAVLRTVGEPSAAGRTAIPSLYRAVYALRMSRKEAGREFRVEPLRARWPNAPDAPPAEWVGEWALPIPDDVSEVPAKDAEIEVADWEYGPTAEIVHAGPYATEQESVRKLLAFVEGLGYEIAGPHEEEYLTRPDAKEPRTVVRYPVRRRGAPAAVDG